jgi:hypothetical protein
LLYVDWLLAGLMDLQEVGCEGMDWIELAQDRDKWRHRIDPASSQST